MTDGTCQCGGQLYAVRRTENGAVVKYKCWDCGKEYGEE
jgi:predicted SprT family Zn-dependent metalloprotease